MTVIRCIYHGEPPEFPASDQHPDARRYGPIKLGDGSTVFVDAIGDEPSLEEIAAVLSPPPPPSLTTVEKLAASGITIAELKTALGL